MKTRCKTAFAVAACLFVASAAQAVGVISYNIDNNSTVGGDGAGSFVGANAVAGVVESAYWYNTWPDYPTTDLVDNTGATTTVDIAYTSASGTYSITGAHNGQDEDGSWNLEMLNGYLNGTGSNSVSFTFSEIPYNGYDIYVYFGSDNADRYGTVSDGTTTYSFGVLNGMVAGTNALFVQTTSTDLEYPEANYAVFSNLSGSSKTVYTSFMASGQYGGICAVQLVENTNALFGISASPEGEMASNTVELEATIMDGIAEFASAELYLDEELLTTVTTTGSSSNTVRYEAAELEAGMHEARIDIYSASSGAEVAQSYSWSFELLAFGSLTTSPAWATTDDTPEVSVVVEHGASAVDTTATELFVDGIEVTAVFDVTSSNTTISGVSTESLSYGSHTGKVVIVGSPSGGPQTNTWSILVAAAVAPPENGVISWNYDASGTAGSPDGVSFSPAGAGAYPAPNWNNSWWSENTTDLMDHTGASTTMDIEWASLNTYQIQGSNPGVDADGMLNREMLNGYLNAGPATWAPATTNSSVTLSQIPYSSYDIYVYVSSDVAGREFYVTDGSTSYYANSMGAASLEDGAGNAVFVQATDATTNGYATAANYVVFSGLSGESQVLTAQFHYNDEWGGIAGIQVVSTGTSGPTEEPVITAISVSGTDVTISWTDEGVGTYSIERKTDLSGSEWTTVASGMPAGTGSTNVTASGETQEFYQITGE